VSSAPVTLPAAVAAFARTGGGLARPASGRTAFCAGVLAAAALALAPSTARGDDGYFSGTLGARAGGRAGAFTAKADDLTAVSFNPAGLAKIDSTLIQIGNSFSYNNYSYTRATTTDYGNVQNGVAPRVAFASVSNQSPWQAVDPVVGVASKLGLKDWAFALAAYAPPGIANEDFPQDGGQRYMMVSREALILDYSASAAWKYNDTFGLGVTLSWIHVPQLNYSLVIDGDPLTAMAHPVSSPYDMLASTTGSDAFTFNAILGGWYRPVPFLEFGISGQVIPADITTQSQLSITPLNKALEGNVVLTRNALPANDVTVTLPLPMILRTGARYRQLEGKRELFDVEVDVDYETWSRVKSFLLATNGLVANFQGQSINIGDINIAKNWNDTVAIKLGGDYALIPDKLTLRGGVYYETAVANAAYSNVDFPGGQEIGAALGASVFFGHVELAAAYEARVQPAVTIAEADARVYQQVPGSPCQAPYTNTTTCNPNYLGQPSPAINAGTYTAQSHTVSLDVLYRF
jgi:long-chain fatty acid transport protein